jgi:hypothetical protein
MKTWMVVLAAVGTLAVGPGTVLAQDCPALIAEARALLEQVKKSPGGLLGPIRESRVASAEVRIRSAEAAHAAEQHDVATREANEALRVLRPPH